MKQFKKVWKLFSSMPVREKIAVCVLAAAIVLSIGEFIVFHVRFPASSAGDIFVEGMVGRVRILNPLFVDFNDTDRDLAELIFSGLVRYDPLEKNFFPDLAASWERSSNGLVYTIILRNDAKWHDGKLVTPDDVLFTFNDVIKDPSFRNPILKNAFEGITVERTGEQTIAFTLPKSNSFFISNLTVGILPKHLLENADIATLDKNPFNKQPVGSGPYKIDHLTLDANDGDVVNLAIFEDYYGNAPKIKQLRFFTFPDEDSLANEQITLHAVSKLDSGAELAQHIKEDPRFNIYSYTLNQFTALFFNTQQLFLQEKDVRLALQYGLDKTKLVLAGQKRVDTIGQSEQPENPYFKYDFAKAAEMLDKLKLAPSENGIRKNDKNERMEFQLLTNEKMPTALAEELKTQWKNLGVEIEIKIAESEEFFRYVSERRYDMLLISQNLGYNRDVYPLFHSSQAGGAGNSFSGLNFSNFKSFRTDGLTEAMRKEQNPADKEKLLQQLSSVITQETPVIFISTPVYSYAIDKRLEAFPTLSLDYHSDRLSVLLYLNFEAKSKTD